MGNKNLTNAAIMAAIAVIMVIAGVYIPPLFFILFFIPVPISIICVRSNISYAILAIIVLFIASFIFTDIIIAATVAVISLMGVVMGYLISKKQPSQEVVKDTGVISLLGLVAILYILKLFGINVINDLLSVYTKVSNEFITLYKNAPNEALVRSMLTSMVDTIKITIPSMFIIMIAFMVVINYMMVTRILIGKDISVQKLPPFMLWRMPYTTGWIFIGTLLYQYFAPTNIVSINLMLLLSTGFTISGLAYVKYYMTRKFHVKPAISNIVLILLFMFPVTFSLMTLLGVIDTGMNLRRFT
ncbi:DUF2232 domain-containing protein [Thermoanaerobacterium sp. RBIITD]|uniref:DUF2232 domain-containing protein n=1 Tax=Thermoanaerobacterium sp. RBIITD TaxID=1550240 RepID=UPI000BB8D317|nr:DUF2232 domain-containing protein [Thermoanaerobacterium sp. RBIITD]SNX53755.1 Uncharacterized conserved protein YybS, DUF2232 family [Thermoanaerobacterium sp. RBIITD]